MTKKPSKLNLVTLKRMQTIPAKWRNKLFIFTTQWPGRSLLQVILFENDYPNFLQALNALYRNFSTINDLKPWLIFLHFHPLLSFRLFAKKTGSVRPFFTYSFRCVKIDWYQRKTNVPIWFHRNTFSNMTIARHFPWTHIKFFSLP